MEKGEGLCQMKGKREGLHRRLYVDIEHPKVGGGPPHPLVEECLQCQCVEGKSTFASIQLIKC